MVNTCSENFGGHPLSVTFTGTCTMPDAEQGGVQQNWLLMLPEPVAGKAGEKVAPAGILPAGAVSVSCWPDGSKAETGKHTWLPACTVVVKLFRVVAVNMGAVFGGQVRTKSISSRRVKPIWVCVPSGLVRNSLIRIATT